MLQRTIFFLFLLGGVLVSLVAKADDNPRTFILLDKGWGYRPVSDTGLKSSMKQVTVPHTWNANYIPGTRSYNREMMVYRRDLEITPDMKDKRLFLYFEGVNSSATVLVNNKSVGSHKGGYTAFCMEVTDYAKQGINKLEVWVTNAYNPEILPISGDFNIYGGIHRPCHLLVTEQDCISPLFYASPGVFIHQDKVSEKQAQITVETMLSLRGKKQGLKVRTTVEDAKGNIISQNIEQNVTNENVKQPFVIDHPVLWNAKQNPHLYKVIVELLDDGKVIDRVEQRTGLRYFSVDADKGFFLNGKYLDLYGFCLHEEVEGKGSALSAEDHERDMELVKESGVTSLRLVHYPHSESIYHLSDENGIVLWTEIPMVGPGGYDFCGFINTDGLKEHARQVLKELVYQKYNHPSICFWGIFNEIRTNYDNAEPFARELHELYKEIDPSRLTTLASCDDPKFYQNCSDLMAWNKYIGWYGSRNAPETAGNFFDKAKVASNGKPVAISEYGGGANVEHHFSMKENDVKPSGQFHPEEGQTYIHEGNWSAFAQRPYMWAKYIWVFADFQSAIRNEGGKPGINDKGLVTYDRKIKKDVFYFYKANWSTEPMIYITSRRFTERPEASVQVKVYSNLRENTLYVNGKKIGKQKSDSLHRVVWQNVTLSKGENRIRVEGKSKAGVIEDTCVWYLK
ncbi:glycoside hydrolase family 2 protein [Bacteroides thetaiotaomicron]|uniref:Glycoside hydrolase family 2 protein n=2 Tax=Bacteroides thetaiotaomicron TaxID=818 RepID=A0AAW4Z9X1_BACT4|nr:glycoside hydrolase family 2 protein [Bacteroides thetaiotaomicron]MCE9266006.1 glycoside hydrolase family 2 protein [Bacteroides thetaiotaomicron]MCE9275543.1 glycoside hydrolase family 2 protein [Bacteroides thetaiotaomicron]MCE9292517.1 glycoside hydrolase family 2 protein [Bacteroides thetaiotaomicron]